MLGVIACVGLLFMPAGVIAKNPKPVEVKAPVPLPVTGDVNATVTGDVNVTSMPEVTVGNDSSNPVPVKVQDGMPTCVTTEYRYVGITELQVPDTAFGVFDMNAWCQGEFGPDARMCTTEEFFKSPVVGGTEWEDTVMAWIQPVIVTTYEAFSLDEQRVNIFVDYTGASQHQLYDRGNQATLEPGSFLSCKQWTCFKCDGAYGATISGWHGGVTFQRCTDERPVVCCGPATNGP